MAIFDTKSRDIILRYHFPLARLSYAEELPSGSVDQACHTLGLKPKPNFCFPISVPTAMAHTPFRLGLLEPHHRMVPGLSKETVPIPLATTLQIRRKFQGPRGHPIVEDALDTQGILTQDEQLFPLRLTERCPQRQELNLTAP